MICVSTSELCVFIVAYFVGYVFLFIRKRKVKEMKKIELLAIVFAVLLVLSACGTNQSISKEPENDELSITGTVESVIESSDSTLVAGTTKSNHLDFLGTDYYYAITNFSEGIAWIDYENLATAVTKEGDIIFQLDKSILYATPFKNGVSYIVTQDLSEIIIDSNGNELYSASNTDDIQEHIITQGDDMFLVIRHVTNMTNNSFELTTIDKNGAVQSSCTLSAMDKISQSVISIFSEITVKYQEEGTSYTPDFEYCGNGVFYYYKSGCGSAFYNSSRNTLNNDGYLLQGTIDNENYWVYKTYMNGNVLYDIQFGVLNTSQNQPEFIVIDNPKILNASSAKGLGKYWYADRHIYDQKGNEVCYLNAYSELGVTVGIFSYDGYAPATFSGKDSKYYLTFINESGEEQFSPIKCDSSSLVCYGVNRFAICDYDCTVSVYDTSGNKKEIATTLFEPIACEYVGEDYIMAGHKYYFY